MKRILTLAISFLGVSLLSLGAQGIDTPASALVGQTSGLRISGSDGTLTGAYSAAIRGLNSLRGDTSPLIIVDGVMLDNTLPGSGKAFWQDKYAGQTYNGPVNLLGFFSAEDIESIEVLKDVAATAIYGSRGANGVIIIKTKKTKEDDQTVAWKSNLGMTSFSNFSHSHNLMVNGSHGRNTFTASAFFRGEDDGYSPSDNLSGGVRFAFEAAASQKVKFGLTGAFGVQQVNALSTASLYGSPSMSLDKIAGKDISGWLQDYDDFYIDYHAVSDAHIDINFAKNFSWKTRFGVNYQSNKRFNFYGKTTDFGGRHNSAAAIVSSSMMNYHASTEVDFDIFVAVDHHVTARVGVEASGNRNIYNTMNGVDLISPLLRAKSLNLTNSKAEIRTFKPSYLHLATFADASYDYKGIAGVSATVRVDNTMRYDDASVMVYPSASAYFDVARLLLSQNEYVSSIRLTGGWGMAGKESSVPYIMFPDYFTSGDYPAVDAGAESVIEGFDKLITREFNAGLQVGLLRNRITAQVKYYDRLTSDVFSIFRFAERNENTGRWKYSSRCLESMSTDVISNRGLEVDIHAKVIDTRLVDWDITANAAFQSNQVAVLSKDSILGAAVGADGMTANVNAVGHSISSLYGYDTDAEGNFLDHTGDGKVAPEDRIILGRTQPKMFGSLSTSLKVWNFTLDALIDGAAGHNLLNMTAMVKDEAGAVTSKYVEKGDFLRLNKVRVGYSFPLVKVKWIRALDLSVSGYNLACLTGYSGVNPDADSFCGSNFTRGIDMGAMPMTSALMFGIGLKF